MKLRKIMFLLVIVLSSGCSFYKAQYDIVLKEVERPSQAKERYGEQKIFSTKEEGVDNYVFEDEMVKIIWVPQRSQFSFKLDNKSSNSIKIIWDEAVYVDANGTSQRVMHSGVKYTDRNSSQPPTVIVRGGSINDLLLPTDNVYYVSGQYGGWNTRSLFPSSGKTLDDIKLKASIYKNKEVQILLPLQIEDVINEYIFVFKINNINYKQ